MQQRLLLVLGILGALAGLALLIALYSMEPAAGARDMPQVEKGPSEIPAAPEPEAKAERLSGTLKGRVVNGQTGAGIPGAKVVALTPHLEPAKDEGEIPTWGGLIPRKHVLTDAEGQFALADLPPDYWNLWVEKRGYAWTTVPRAKFDDEHEIRLYPACSVKGRVVYPDDTPAAGVRIEYHVQGTHSEVFSRYKLESYYTQTREDGTFEYGDLPPGKFTVEVYPHDHLPAPWAYEPPLKPGENRDLGTHKLDGGNSMTVHVRWRETKEPVPDVEVVVRPVGDPMPRTKTGQRRRTDTNGVARFQGLSGQLVANPQFLVAANVDGVGPVPPDEGSTQSAGADVTIWLRKDGVVTGRVLRPNGDPLEHFFVELEAVGHVARQLRVWGEDGGFKVYQVPEGRYLLHVRFGNLIDESIPIEVRGGEELDVGEIRLREGAQITGVVRWSNGKELEGVVRVNLGRKVKNAAGNEMFEQIGRGYCLADGSYILKGVAPGTYWLWPESMKSPSNTTDPVKIEVPPGVGALQQDLTLFGEGFLVLHFFDLHEGRTVQVTAPPTFLVETATGREIRWMSEGQRLRPGSYTLFVELKNEEGVPRRYKVREVEVLERGGPGQGTESVDPIEVRLFEIRDGN